MIKTIKDFDLKDKLVLLRVDINSPVVDGKILDNPRINESASTISILLKKKSRLVIIAHQGRKGDSDFTSLEQHAKLLSKRIKSKIKYVDDLFDELASREISSLKSGNAILLKNVREFNDEKEFENSRYQEFSKKFDIYVNEAFSVSHRAQGSVVVPPKIINSCAGPALDKEIMAISRFSPDKKSVFLIGGSKIEDYIPIFNNLENKNSVVLASGILANLMLVSKGINLGYENKWLEEKGYSKLMPKLKELLLKYPNQIILPVDFAVGDKKISKKVKREEMQLTNFPSEKKIWDVGRKTIEIFSEHIKTAENIFMKGPLGYSEIKVYSVGTVSILNSISKASKSKKSFSLLGGGHLSTTIKKYKIPNTFSHISTAGGALIAFISRQKLPGLEALER